MGRYSKAAKKKIHEIAHVYTYRSTTGTPVGSTSNAGEVNEQEEPTPSIVSDKEQESLNEAEYSASENGDQGKILGGRPRRSMAGMLKTKMRSCQSWKEDLCESLRIRVGEINELANAEQASQTAYAAIMQELSAKD
jgi:phage tail tape-measure protein